MTVFENCLFYIKLMSATTLVHAAERINDFDLKKLYPV